MPRKAATAEQRFFVAEQAKDCCEYCRSPADFAASPYEVDHVIPISREGPTILDNLAWACRGCNLRKHDKTEAPDPIDDTVVPLFNPRRQRWKDHFRWNEDYTIIIGLTPTGRATVETLQVNRKCLVNIREVLFAQKKHPPSSR